MKRYRGKVITRLTGGGNMVGDGGRYTVEEVRATWVVMREVGRK